MVDPATEVQDVEGHRLVVGRAPQNRDPCNGEDLAHFIDLPNDVDGVLFTDCIISWVGGGRSRATDVGIECRLR